MIVDDFVKFSYLYYSTLLIKRKHYEGELPNYLCILQICIGFTSVLMNEFYPSKQLPADLYHNIIWYHM